jgi:hypothetical protein
MSVEQLLITTIPNEKCAIFCPILDQDKLLALQGNVQAEDDYLRHCQESQECSGTQIENGGRKCPLFGVEIKS